MPTIIPQPSGNLLTDWGIVRLDGVDRQAAISYIEEHPNRIQDIWTDNDRPPLVCRMVDEGYGPVVRVAPDDTR